MGLVSINWKPSQKEIRGFGRSLLIGFGLIGLALYFYFELPSVAIALWGVGIVAFLLSYTIPKLALVIYYPWMGVSMVMGTVISTLIVAIIFYLLLTPLGLFFKLIGRDPLQKKLEKEADTYWVTVKRTKPYDVKTYEAQF